MKRSLSLYLDLLRFLAAFAVYIFHAQHFAGASVPYVGNLGGEAVIVFFVLSGMLITLAGRRQTDPGEFVQARLARLWSVCLPALALTLVADVAGQALALASYHPMQPYSAFKWVASIGINALFLNQVWGLSIYPGTNGPFWSLSYEFWYYMLFAACFYFRGAKRLVAVVCAVAVMGPWILQAFPIWLLGAAVWLAIGSAADRRAAIGWVVWLGSFVAAFAFSHFDVHGMLANAFPQTAANAKWDVNFWPASYLMGAIVAMNIVGFAWMGQPLEAPLQKLSGLIRVGADISFGLYLFHYPLMYLSKAVLNACGVTGGASFVAFVYVAPFIVAAVLALQCEKRKAVVARAIRGVVSAMAALRRRALADRQAVAAGEQFFVEDDELGIRVRNAD